MYSQETNKANTVAVCKRQGVPLRDVQFCAEFVSLVHILFTKKKDNLSRGLVFECKYGIDQFGFKQIFTALTILKKTLRDFRLRCTTLYSRTPDWFWILLWQSHRWILYVFLFEIKMYLLVKFSWFSPDILDSGHLIVSDRVVELSNVLYSMKSRPKWWIVVCVPHPYCTTVIKLQLLFLLLFLPFFRYSFQALSFVVTWYSQPQSIWTQGKRRREGTEF